MNENWIPVDWVRAADKHTELSEWVLTNIPSADWIDDSARNFTVLFKYEQDAIAFKLKFEL
jgi:hypothetical protein